MRVTGRLFLLTVMAAAVIGVTACGDNDDNKNAATGSPKATTAVTPPAGSPATSPAASPAAGGTSNVNAEAIYKQNCLACHGDKLDGMGDAKRNLTKTGGKYSKDQIVGIISDGRGGMPAFKSRLKAEEINALSDWLAAKK